MDEALSAELLDGDVRRKTLCREKLSVQLALEELPDINFLFMSGCPESQPQSSGSFSLPVSSVDLDVSSSFFLLVHLNHYILNLFLSQ